VELDSVIEFKRQVYRQALIELSHLLDCDIGKGCDYGYIENNQIISKTAASVKRQKK
jgi:putative (di)nucleoside polyphosphate hydrolase